MQLKRSFLEAPHVIGPSKEGEMSVCPLLTLFKKHYHFIMLTLPMYLYVLELNINKTKYND